MPVFSHLHCHTQFSLLDGAADISKLMKKAKADGMPAVALTDHGNMFGAFKFVAEAAKNDVKPIVGCEFYMVANRHKKEFTKEDKDVRVHQLLLAKNQEGYKNLAKLCSIGYMDGLYSKWPRIDKEILLKYHTGLIATTCCIGAEVPQAILHQGEAVAEEKFKWWLDLFGEDYYVELQRHKLDDQVKVNETLLRFAAKYNVKIIASNDSHYVNRDDSNAHDILLCVNTGELQSKPVWKGDGFGGKDYRFGFPNDEFYFKNTAEMSELFKDLPQAIDNTNEIVDKVEILKLKKDILLPNFPIPPGFTDGDDYLRYLTYEGAKRRYNGLPLNAEVKPDENLPLPQEVVERLDFELHTIKTMGFAGYFLIVSDFIKAGRELGVMIGPGRGSAAGSAVAYCIGITNLDPVKYQLLFERFLNPDRKSMPDIDTDFDDEGRQKVIDYVVEKYGRNQVAQIITYGTMATKSAIKDVARVMEFSLAETNLLTKLIPDKPTYGMNFQKLVHMPLDELSDIVTPDELENVKKVRQFYSGKDLVATVLKEAEKLEGTVRNSGIHAAGIIIAPSDLTEIIPVATSKETDLLITQFDGKVIEDAGVIKMDFLGLRNLTIIRDCLELIKRNHGVDLDIDTIPLDDAKTYELFQRGETNAVFQFESDGMKKYMKDLKPDRFDDLIAMNALYRPGPIAYIPNYVNRKHGREDITYDLPEMAEYLHETYGICVAGDTLVHNAETGKRVRIDQLKDSVGKFWVQSVDDQLQSKPALLTHWVCNGKKPVLELKLRNGNRVKLTANHKVLTERGWIEVGELQTGDYVATPRQLHVNQSKTYDRDKLRVLAYLLADGCIGRGATAEFTSKDERLLDAYRESVNIFGNLEINTIQQIRQVIRLTVKGTQKTHYHQPNNLVAALRQWDLKDENGGCGSQDKFVPDFVFGLTEPDLAFFLAALWDCDGHIAPKLCHFKTISSQLAHGVQTLLLRLGIHSTAYETAYWSDCHKKNIIAYQVTVYDLTTFAKKIAVHLLTKQMHVKRSEKESVESKDSLDRTLFLDELSQAWTGSGRALMAKYGFSRQHLLPASQQRSRISSQLTDTLTPYLEMPRTKQNRNVRWEQITSLKSVGEEMVYDITVEETHNFVGNNIILHNCVYQEQVMLLSQKLAGFSKGDADILRKAMGKKDRKTLDKLKPQFIENAKAKGLPEKKLAKIWTDWEAFASYAFNKSHSTCYAFVAYQTAYLKTHYPGEYMAAVLTSSLGNIEKITFFLEECKRMGVPVLGPDVNESSIMFDVNKAGQIRFGLGAIKGAGEAAVGDLIQEREANGPYKDIFDVTKRVNLRTVNKKTFESLAYAGAFDEFGLHRAQYFHEEGGTLIEKSIKYGNQAQSEKGKIQQSLFGGLEGGGELPPPRVVACEQWTEIERLKNEKEVVGFYISGHPLDQYRIEMSQFAITPIDQIETFKNREINIAGIVSKAGTRISKNGNPFTIFTLEDYGHSLEIALFGENHVKFANYLQEGGFIFIKGKYEPRFYNATDQFEFKPMQMQLLSEMRQKLCKGVQVNLDLARINAPVISKLAELAKNYPGDCELRISLSDPQEKMQVEGKSRLYRINPSNELIKEIENMNGVGFRLVW